jgi:hypothetical protein
MSSTICQLLTTVAELQIYLKGLNDDQQEEEFMVEMRIGKMSHKEGRDMRCKCIGGDDSDRPGI